jgi:hypothetical protein
MPIGLVRLKAWRRSRRDRPQPGLRFEIEAIAANTFGQDHSNFQQADRDEILALAKARDRQDGDCALQHSRRSEQTELINPLIAVGPSTDRGNRDTVDPIRLRIGLHPADWPLHQRRHFESRTL